MGCYPNRLPCSLRVPQFLVDNSQALNLKFERAASQVVGDCVKIGSLFGSEVGFSRRWMCSHNYEETELSGRFPARYILAGCEKCTQAPSNFGFGSTTIGLLGFTDLSPQLFVEHHGGGNHRPETVRAIVTLSPNLSDCPQVGGCNAKGVASCFSLPH